MDIVEIAQDYIKQNVSEDINLDSVSDGMSSLFADENGDIDMASIVSNFSQNGGLTSMVSSWLGNDENEQLDEDTVQSMFSNEQISSFASNLGIQNEAALSLISGLVPTIIDKVSSDGGILDNIGGLDGAMDFAKKFF